MRYWFPEKAKPFIRWDRRTAVLLRRRWQMGKGLKDTERMTLTNRLYCRYKVLVPKTISVFFIILYLSMSTFLSSASDRTSVGFIIASTGDVYIYHKDAPLGIDVIAAELVYPGDL
ncbi:MAG: hypothetical protein ACYSTI_14290, partial [Planctomycetota bacterium]